MFDVYVWEGIVILALVSGVPLLVSCVVGVVVSILQTATQIQEQTLQFVVRVSAVSVVLLLGGGWFLQRTVDFVQRMLVSIAFLGKMP